MKNYTLKTLPPIVQKLLGVDTNSKTVKGRKRGFMTGIVYLAPSDESGAINTCPNASAGCREACLFSAGRGAMDNVRQPRIQKTLSWANNPDGWLLKLASEINSLMTSAARKGLTPCVRLNGTSDIPWEKYPVNGANNIMELFPNVQFYDYTKSPQRVIENKIKNYHLTFSRSESNAHHVKRVMAKSDANIAIVFRGKLPNRYQGRKVINGDDSDLRFLDPKKCIVGLVDKGKAKKDSTGFVIEVAS